MNLSSQSSSSQLTLDEQMCMELDSYLSESAGGDSIDPRMWWNVNRQRFRNVARVARVYLAIPATSVASERLFSKAGLTVGTRRGNLSPEHVEHVVFLNQNLRQLNINK
jgi:hypothetical protein